MKYAYYQSPIGRLLLVGKDGKLFQLGFPRGKMARKPEANWLLDEEYFAEIRIQLDEYFAGKRKHFALDLSLQGSPFQKDVWSGLQQIPYGEVFSYSKLAEDIGNPKAARAVGAANGRNPIPIIIPCHRVIGKNGDLTGFGGGMETKEFLLRLEGYLD